MFGKFSAEIKKLCTLFITKHFVIQNNEVKFLSYNSLFLHLNIWIYICKFNKTKTFWIYDILRKLDIINFVYLKRKKKLHVVYMHFREDNSIHIFFVSRNGGPRQWLLAVWEWGYPLGGIRGGGDGQPRAPGHLLSDGHPQTVQWRLRLERASSVGPLHNYPEFYFKDVFPYPFMISPDIS